MKLFKNHQLKIVKTVLIFLFSNLAFSQNLKSIVPQSNSIDSSRSLNDRNVNTVHNKQSAVLNSDQLIKEWTFLVFINGHNNLSQFGHLNIRDMEKTGSTDQLNLVVEWGKADDEYTHRLLVEKSTDPTRVTSPMLMSRKNVDMGDYKEFVDFVKWGIQNYPAKKYFVAVWNHGSGWHFQNRIQNNNNLNSNNNNSDFFINDISFDDNTGNVITTEQLGMAMKEIQQFLGRPVDIYGSDACLMQMIEVAQEMAGAVSYFAGSQDLEPGEGWPYDPFVKKWAAQPQMSAAEVSTLLSKEYLKAYTGGVYGERDVTFSVLDMSYLDQLNLSIKEFVADLKNLGQTDLQAVKKSILSTQSYYYFDYKDLGDFIKNVKKIPSLKSLPSLSQVEAALKQVVLTTDNSDEFYKATGLSIWMPSNNSSYMTRYLNLEFDKETKWSDFLNIYLKPNQQGSFLSELK